MAREAIGLGCYGVMSYSYLYLLVFAGDLPAYFPGLKSFFPGPSITAAPKDQVSASLLIDTFLFFIFTAQHSVQSRKSVQRWLAAQFTPAGERLLFVAMSALSLYLLIANWHPIPQVVLWDVRGEPLEVVVWGLYALGFAIVIATTFTTIKYDLNNLRTPFTGEKFPLVPRDCVPFVYQYVRQPLFLGFVLALWAAPVMTLGRLMLAAGWTGYSYIGVTLKEREMAAKMEDYVYYQRKVSAFVPWPREYTPLHQRGRSLASSK